MSLKKHLTTLFIILVSLPLMGQEMLSFSDSNSRERMRYDVYVLSNDSFRGRMTGSAGEEKASAYIIHQLCEAGIKPHPDYPSYKMPFNEMMFAFLITESTLNINGQTYTSARNDTNAYYPIAYSSSGKVRGELVDVRFGITSIENGHDDYAELGKTEGKIFVIETSLPGGFRPDHPLADKRFIRYKMDLAIEHGAKAIIFVNSDPFYTDPVTELKLNVLIRPIPVIFWNKSKELLFKEEHNYIELNVNIVRQQVKGNNVVAYIDNGGEKTVILGAHYDHVGMGELNLSKEKKGKLHPGADDNASGSAMILEIARFLNQMHGLKHNYLFIWFSGEEMGLHGSNSFSRSIAQDTGLYLCMINFDMVGKSGNENKDLIVLNSGSSKEWKKMLNISKGELKKVQRTPLAFGRSDHSPFYAIGLPVLFLHTGTHPDYHTPNDLPDKLNYEGMIHICHFSLNLINEIEKSNEIPFRRIPLSRITTLF